jgi:hypothetical protein
MKRFPILSKVLLIICLSLMLYANVWVPPYPDPPPPPYKYINTAGSTINSIFIIPYVADDPVIDGLLDAAWTFPDVGMFVYANDDLPDGGHTDLSSLFRVAWNENGFYLWGHVIDDSIFASGSDPGEQDCFEIYFDGDNSKGVSYDGNDVRWRWVYGRTDVDSGWTDAGEWVWLETPNGYNFELAIPVADLQKGGTQLFELTEGTVFGFEVQCSDNDGEGRECMTKWWSESNYSWQQPVLFGTARLTLEGGGILEKLAYDIKLSLPSVISSNTTISYSIPARSSVRLTLFNSGGQAVRTLVNEVKDAGTTTVTLDASGLANGVYLCTLEACGGVITQKVTLIK